MESSNQSRKKRVTGPRSSKPEAKTPRRKSARLVEKHTDIKSTAMEHTVPFEDGNLVVEQPTFIVNDAVPGEEPIKNLESDSESDSEKNLKKKMEKSFHAHMGTDNLPTAAPQEFFNLESGSTNPNISHGTQYGGNESIFNPNQQYQLRTKDINDLRLWTEQEFIAENSTLVRFTSHMLGSLNAPMKYAFKDKHLDAWRVQQQLEKHKNGPTLNNSASNPTLTVEEKDYLKIPEEVYDPWGVAQVLMKSETISAVRSGHIQFLEWMTLVPESDKPDINFLIMDADNTGIWEVFASVCAIRLKQVWFSSANRLFTNRASVMTEEQYINVAIRAKRFLISHNMRTGMYDEMEDIRYGIHNGRTNVQALVPQIRESDSMREQRYLTMIANSRDVKL